MNNEFSPLCHFPTTAALVDDKEDYLKIIKKNLSHRQVSYKLFSNPKKALDYLLEASKPPVFIENCIRQEADTARGHRNVDINIFPIREQIYNPARFEILSVLVIDQEMPGMKGLEVCEKLKGSRVKKILLTGEVDDSQAIQAFNDGIINKFVPKDIPNFYEHMNTLISELSTEFLQELQQAIFNGITQLRPGYDTSCLLDPNVSALLSEIVQKNNICEFYLSDDNGSFIFLDESGKPSWLVLKDDDEMEADYYLAEDSDNPPSKKVLQGLKDHKLILHLYTEAEQRDTLAGDWEKHKLLYPAKTLQGKDQSYCYAYINDPNAHDINQDKIMSFKAYQASLSEKQ
jgi:CheY-like chemotaxis protein